MWLNACMLHPEWEHVTLREPISSRTFPITSPFWPLCSSGAQKAGLIRLEWLWWNGGVYLDSDVRMWRPMDELLVHPEFAARENPWAVVDCVIGSEAKRPWLLTALGHAVQNLPIGALQSGPQAVRHAAAYHEVFQVPADGFSPVEAWMHRELAEALTAEDCPNSYGIHLCRNSWGG